MNLSELTDHFREEARDAPEVGELLADIRRRANRRTGERRRWTVLSAVAAVAAVALVAGVVTWHVRSGPNLPSGPAAPSPIPAGPTTPDVPETFSALTSVPYSLVPLPSLTLPAHSIDPSAAAGLIPLQLADIASPVTMPNPPAGLNRHTVIGGPSALAEIWRPAPVDGVDRPNTAYGYIVSTADPITVPGVSTVAPRSAPSLSVGPVSATPALAANAVVTRTTVAGRSFEVVTVPDTGFDLVSATVAQTRLAWQLADGRWIQIFDRGRSLASLVELASRVSTRPHALARTVKVSVTVTGFTDALTSQSVGADSDGATLFLCPKGKVPGLEISDDLTCISVFVSPGKMTVMSTEPAPVPSTLAGMHAQVDDGFAWYQVDGMSMGVQTALSGWSRAQIMAVLASASYTPA